jgi:hypothetical protein
VLSSKGFFGNIAIPFNPYGRGWKISSFSTLIHMDREGLSLSKQALSWNPSNIVVRAHFMAFYKSSENPFSKESSGCLQMF